MKTRTVSLIGASFLVAVSLWLAGCDERAAPQSTGHISLTYDSRTADEVQLSLTNGMPQPIYIRGSSLFSSVVSVWDGDFEVVCETVPYARGDEEPFGSSHGNPKEFSIESGRRRSLAISTKLPERFKGGICRVRLQLVDGRIIGPTEFVP